MIRSENSVGQDKITKKEFALKLLLQSKTNDEINRILKTKFGSGLSNRDLKRLRASIVKIPQDADTYINSFMECFQLLGVINANGLTGENTKELKGVITKYKKIYFELTAASMVNSLPRSLRTNKTILTGILDFRDSHKI